MVHARRITLHPRTEQLFTEKGIEIENIIEIKNEKNLLEQSFAQFDGLQNYLYGTENEHKLVDEYQKSLCEYMKKKYESKIVTKRYYNLDLNLCLLYKQLKHQKMQVKKKLAIVCARELKRALQRTGKVNPALKGRRISKLLTSRLKKKKSSNRKLKEKIVEQQREQKKLNYLINQTELFAHFVLKGETDKMQKVREELEAKTKNIEDTMKIEEMNDIKMQNLQKTVDFENPPVLKHFQGTLKDYQSKGLVWLINLYNSNINGILADDMGLGKTVQTIALLTYLYEKEGKCKFLIVTPVSTLGNWESEIKRFNPYFEINSYVGAERNLFNVNRRKINKKNKESTIENSQEIPLIGQDSLDERDIFFPSSLENDKIEEKEKPLIVLTSYQLINDKKIKKIKFDYLVCDEAQAIKSNRSLRWRNINSLQSKNRLLLTGTPIQNNMAELWALLHFIMPSLFNDHQLFLSFFSNEKSVKKETLDRLHAILKPFMLRREKKDVKNELGVKTEKEVICTMNGIQRKLYDEVFRLKENENMVMQLRKIVNHPALFLKEENGTGFYFKREKIDLSTPIKTKNDWINNLRVLSDHIIIKKKKKNNSEKLDNKKLNCSQLKGKKHLKIHVMADQNSHNIKNHFDFSSSIEQLNAGNASHSNKHRKFVPSIRIDKLNEVKNILLDTKSSNDSHMHFKVNSEIMIENRIEEKFILERKNEINKEETVLIKHGKRKIKTFESYKKIRLDQSIHIESIMTNERIEKDFLLNNFMKRKRIIRNKGLIGIFDESEIESTKEENVKQKVNKMSVKQIENKIYRIINKSLQQSANDYPLHLIRSNLIPKSFSCNPFNDVIKIHTINLKESGKFFVLDSMLKKMTDKRILIYFQMTKMMDLFEEYCKCINYKYVRLDGALKPNERKKIVDKFQNEDIFLFLLSTRAGGLGLNLTKANTVIFYDSDWNPTVDQQAMDRAYRLGNTMDVNVYRLITKDSVEEKMRDSAEIKEEIHRLVIDGGEYTF